MATNSAGKPRVRELPKDTGEAIRILLAHRAWWACRYAALNKEIERFKKKMSLRGAEGICTAETKLTDTYETVQWLWFYIAETDKEAGTEPIVAFVQEVEAEYQAAKDLVSATLTDWNDVPPAMPAVPAAGAGGGPPLAQRGRLPQKLKRMSKKNRRKEEMRSISSPQDKDKTEIKRKEKGNKSEVTLKLDAATPAISCNIEDELLENIQDEVLEDIKIQKELITNNGCTTDRNDIETNKEIDANDDYENQISAVVSKQAKKEIELRKCKYEALQNKKEDFEQNLAKLDSLISSLKEAKYENINTYAKEMRKIIENQTNIENAKDEKTKLIPVVDAEILDLEIKLSELKSKRLYILHNIDQFEQELLVTQQMKSSLENIFEQENQCMLDALQDHEEKKEEYLQHLISISKDIKLLVSSEETFYDEPIKPKLNIDNSSRLFLDHIKDSVIGLENDLECPVCLEITKPPIYMCSESHLVCNGCRPVLIKCPICLVEYEEKLRRHRYAEKQYEELLKLKQKERYLLISIGEATPENGKAIEEGCRGAGAATKQQKGNDEETLKEGNTDAEAVSKIKKSSTHVEKSKEKLRVAEALNIRKKPNIKITKKDSKGEAKSIVSKKGGNTNKEIYVGNIPPEATELDIKLLFEQFGEVDKVVFNGVKVEQYGFVTFDKEESAEKAVTFGSISLYGNDTSVFDDIYIVNWGPLTVNYRTSK